jgi:hypothetical protein
MAIDEPRGGIELLGNPEVGRRPLPATHAWRIKLRMLLEQAHTNLSVGPMSLTMQTSETTMTV